MPACLRCALDLRFEWVSISFSSIHSQSLDCTGVCRTGGGFFTNQHLVHACSAAAAVSESSRRRTPARQTPLSVGFSRQEYWAGLPCPPPGDLPHPGIERASLLSPVLAVLFLLILPPGNPRATRQTMRDAFRETRKPRHVWWLDCPGGVALREVRQGDRARRAHTRVGLSGPKSYEWKQRRNMAARN